MSAESVDAGRGFMLAVDQSPDVSHAPGADAGDHLGGVDVELVAVGTENGGTAGQVGRLLDDGASVVVVLFVPSTAAAIASAADERDKLALVVGDDTSSIADRTLLLRPRDAGTIDPVGVAAATTEFRKTFGAEATRAALLGYDAGRLLDTIVAQIGHVLQPTEPLIAAALAADTELTSSSVVAAGDGEGGDAGPGNTAGGDSNGPPDIRLSAASGVAVLVAAGAVVVMVRRRRSPAAAVCNRPFHADRRSDP